MNDLNSLSFKGDLSRGASECVNYKLLIDL